MIFRLDGPGLSTLGMCNSKDCLANSLFATSYATKNYVLLRSNLRCPDRGNGEAGKKLDSKVGGQQSSN